MSLHKEIEFENDICAHLAGAGWLRTADDAMTRGRSSDFPAATCNIENLGLVFKRSAA